MSGVALALAIVCLLILVVLVGVVSELHRSLELLKDHTGLDEVVKPIEQAAVGKNILGMNLFEEPFGPGASLLVVLSDKGPPRD
jgi:hypothetical protein